MRARLPGAVEIVYDNDQFLAIGFGPNERASEAVFSIAVSPQRVNLCFLWGAGLPDPDGRLSGSGNQVRNVELATAEVLDEPAVRTLMAEALASRDVVMDDPANRRLVIKSVSAKQRPRR